MKLINLGLMSRWQNWATILLMLLIAVFAINFLSRRLFPSETGA